ncbi:MAG: GIY-YIG nuclease family protein [Phormidesmis sp.]
MTTDLLNLPAVSAIYRVWHCDHVVYVGQTKNLRERWKNHHILPKLLVHYGVDWRLDWIEISPLYLNRAEAFAYRHFRPVLNRKNPSELLGIGAE